MKPYYFKDMIEVVIKEHYDIDSKSNGQPPNVVRRAVMNCWNKINVSKTKDHKPFGKKSKHVKNLDIGFTNINAHANINAPPAGFVNNREPPTGHSIDTNEWLNIRGSGW